MDERPDPTRVTTTGWGPPAGSIAAELLSVTLTFALMAMLLLAFLLGRATDTPDPEVYVVPDSAVTSTTAVTP